LQVNNLLDNKIVCGPLPKESEMSGTFVVIDKTYHFRREPLTDTTTFYPFQSDTDHLSNLGNGVDANKDGGTPIDTLFKPFDPSLPFFYPRKGTSRSYGYDLYCSASGVIQPKSQGYVATNTCWSPIRNGRVLIPGCSGGLLRERSSVGKKRCFCVAGVIDLDYEGHIGILMENASDEPLFYGIGERLAQLVVNDARLHHLNGAISHSEKMMLDKAGIVPKDVRGTGGFGSTGQ
jgi:dUTP pyrophosphatase